MNTNQGITALIVLFFVVLVGYWFVNSYKVTTVPQTVPLNTQAAGVYNAYQTAPTYPVYTATPAAPVYAVNPAAPVYAYPAYNNAYPAYSNSYVPPTTYVTYPIARSTAYSSSYYSSPGYYNSYTTSTNPGGTYPGQNCYTQPNGSSVCTYQQQY
jgi:hypothetical protein